MRVFLEKSFSADDFRNNVIVNGKGILDHFISLDDTDIVASLKSWRDHPDFILSYLSKGLTDRRLFAARITPKPVSERDLHDLKMRVCRHLDIDFAHTDYFVIHKEVSNRAYSKHTGSILILDKMGKVSDIRQASDINLSVLTKMVLKFFVSYPKELVFN